MRSRLLVPSLLLCSCASAPDPGPYLPASDDITAPGYRETLIAPATYHVVYTAANATTLEAAERMARRRANELCSGPFVELPPDMRSIEVSSCHHWNDYCGPAKAQLWIRCNTPPHTTPAP